MKFKVGQRVILIDGNGMNALVGSIAVIECIDNGYLYITWTTPQTQDDGGYFPSHFKPMLRKNQQLLFSFMEE